MQDIEDSVWAKIAGAVLVDLTAAYDTMWHADLPVNYSDCYLTAHSPHDHRAEW